MASSEGVGDLGPARSKPVSVEWHGYYHLPGFAGWALIVALLASLKENRNRQAWLILIPFLLLGEVLLPAIERLAPRQMAEQYGIPLQWLLLALTTVWLVSPWLARRRAAIAVVVVATVAAVIATAGTFGGDRFVSRYSLAEYAVWVLALVSAFLLSRLCCRRRYSRRRFLTWLAIWLVPSVFIGSACGVTWLLWTRLVDARTVWSTIFELLPRLGLYCLCFAGVLYVLNLPFLCLAFWCPAYQLRFERLLRLPREETWATTPPDASIDIESTAT